MARRRMMMMQNELGEYIQDGLVFFLDATDFEDGSSIWVDKIGGCEFVGDIINKSQNGVSFSTTKKLVSALPISDLFATSGTFEITFKITGRVYSSGTSYKYFLCDTRTKRFSASSAGYGILMFSAGSKTSCGHSNRPIVGSPLLYSYTDAIAYKGSSRLDYGDHAHASQVINGDNNVIIGTSDIILWAVRYYNRRLSVEEMLHNHQIDNKRFHLGL